MTFASRMTRSPLPFDPAKGQDLLSEFPALPGELAELIKGVGGCSPYLAGLARRETDWIVGALTGDPEAALAEALTFPGDRAIGDRLRIAKRRVALLAGLADLAGVWPLEQVTGALTDLADRAVDAALKDRLAMPISRGKIPGVTEDDLDTACGMIAIAMGKMGAHELNYSSDIDLIMLFDETRFDEADYMEARAQFIKVTRQAMALLSDLTGEGYVFRTDLRLRPDPSVTPVCLSAYAAERYYESVGRTWERAAYIKARACAGDLAAGARFLKDLTPFVWRKHLDFAAIQDAHDMRLRIREHKGLGGKLVLEGHNMKLGRGGIREIEFFTQTRQIIAGGRDPDLRDRRTVPGLAALAEKGWVPGDVAAQLTDDYRWHREVEHRLQMINDAQTHDLPTSDDGFARLAAFMGRDVAGLRDELTERLTRVHELTEGFFAPTTSAAPTDTLSDTAREVTARWRQYPALRSARAVEIFNRIKPDLMARLQKTDKPDEALLHLDGFLAGLPAGVQLFSLFEANPQLIDLIVDIASVAPGLANYLSRNSAVLDAVIGGGFFADWPGAQALTQGLTDHLDGLPDYEAKLDGARRWGKEWHFRVGVHQLRGLIHADEAGRQYADLAEAMVTALAPHVGAEFARKHGPAPGRGAMILGMGSLGAGRLTAASDLDMIVIYDPAGVDTSDGPRPLATRTYFARLTQAFVTALTAPMAEGRLYEVDMRLRPSGRQGPVATSLASFTEYQRTEAWTWEHMALTRAHPMAGDAGLMADVEACRRDLLSAPRDGAKVLGDMADMRARLSAAKPARGVLEPKQGPGRMMDIELTAQAGALLAGDPSRDIYAQLAAGQSIGWLSAQDVETLSDAYALVWRLQSAARLLTGDVLDPETLGQGSVAFLLRETGMADLDALAQALADQSSKAAAVIDAALERGVPKT